MQLKTPVLLGLLVVLATSAGALGQSLSPMREAGATPSDIKGFRLIVGNPYKTRLVFIITPMDPGFTVPVDQAIVNFPRIRLAPGASRPIIVQFRIGPDQKERTIGVCIVPEGLEGPIQPRVCGTYTGRRASAGS